MVLEGLKVTRVTGVVVVDGVRVDLVVLRNMVKLYIDHGELTVSQLHSLYQQAYGVKLSWQTLRIHYMELKVQYAIEVEVP